MKLKLHSIAFLLIAFLTVVSCGPKKAGDNSAELDAAKKSLPEEVKVIGGNMPNPSEIPYLIMATGAEYNQSLINDRSRADGYMSQSDKAAMNLGLYAADIGYVASYEKAQESIDYLNTCKALADNLGVTGSFDPNTLARFEKNIGNKDSLAILLDEAFRKTDQYLTGNSSQKLASLMVTGSFTEGLFLATGIIKTYPRNVFADETQRTRILSPLMKIVIDQRPSVTEVLRILSAVEQTGSIPTIVADLKELEAAYKALNIDQQIIDQKKPMEFTDQTLKDINRLVEKLRTDIVK